MTSIRIKITSMIILAAAIALAVSSGCERAPALATVVKKRIRVSLEIDYQGNRENHSMEFELTSDKTVFGVLTEAAESGVLEIETTGSGETAFVKSINGVENEKSTGNNWIYYVNGTLGDRGAGTYKLSDQDKVQWKFTEYRLK